jgi:4a-hydroxytetrahydrobiopterin dehydratase
MTRFEYGGVMVAMARIARSMFDQWYAVDEWRVVHHSLVAEYVAPDFKTALAFVGDAGRVGDDANHHPDIDLRYPGVVRISLTTHSVGGLTSSDASMARTISSLARKRELRSELPALGVLEIAIDAMNIPAVLPFWRAVLGYANERAVPDSNTDALVDPRRIGPTVWFQQMSEPRPQRNRIHLDLMVPHDAVEERLKNATDAGGTLLSAEDAPAFWILADPEGNEICLCTWQGRD